MKLNELSLYDVKRLVADAKRQENRVIMAVALVTLAVTFVAAVGGIVYYISKRRREDDLFEDDEFYCDDECCGCGDYDRDQDRRVSKLEQKIRKHEEKASQLREQLDAVTAYEIFEDDDEIEE